MGHLTDIREFLGARQTLGQLRTSVVATETRAASMAARDAKLALREAMISSLQTRARLPCGAIVKLQTHGSMRALTQDRMDVAMSHIAREDLLGQDAVNHITRAIMDARNVPSQSIKIAVTEKPLKMAVDAASDDIVQHANSFRDADARARALRALFSARELAIKNTMKTILPSIMSWMGEMGIENQPIGWKSDVGQHGKFTLRLCEKTRPVRLTKQIIATKAAEAVGVLQAANDIELLSL